MNYQRWLRSIKIFLVLAFCLSGCVHHRARTHDDMIRYGVRLAEKGYWREAAVQWRKVLEEDPDNVAALNNLGVAAEVKDHPEEGRKLLTAALSKSPDDQRIRRNLASINDREDKENTREEDDDS